MYPEELILPMKNELTQNGFEDLNTPESVEAILNKKETTLIVVNSVCGCAAGALRPGVLMSLSGSKKPAHMGTVFAGFDKPATEAARGYMLPFPPSSPSIALFKEGELVHMVERHHIEGRTAEMIAENLKMAYEEYC
ncbi:MAG: BrxA/BrxB family bacilliredoxin [Flavobacteriales bacterium]